MTQTPAAPYRGERYLPLSELYERYEALAQAHPDWITLERIATTRAGHHLLLLTLSAHRDAAGVPVSAAEMMERPGLWIDAGTHAAEWAGVSAALYDVERWIELLSGAEGSEEERERERAWFREHVILSLIHI